MDSIMYPIMLCDIGHVNADKNMNFNITHKIKSSILVRIC